MSTAERRRLEKERDTKSRMADHLARTLRSTIADIRELDAQLQALDATTPEQRRKLLHLV